MTNLEKFAAHVRAGGEPDRWKDDYTATIKALREGGFHATADALEHTERPNTEDEK